MTTSELQVYMVVKQTRWIIWQSPCEFLNH